MKILSQYDVNGDFVNLKVSKKNHITDRQINTSHLDQVTESFSNLFNKALNEVNDLELKSTDLTNQMAIDPDSVNIHDVQIAAEQAEMAVLMTKGVIDRVTRAYRELTSLR